METLTITSPAFKDNETIPAKYTCDNGSPPSPPLMISGVPEGAQSLVLIMDDPDIPAVAKESRGIEAFDHWVVYNLPVRQAGLPAGQPALSLEEGSIPAPAAEGLNTAGMVGYAGPCPPADLEPKEHRYVFSLYALREPLRFVGPPTAGEVRAAMVPHIIVEAKLIGRYSRT